MTLTNEQLRLLENLTVAYDEWIAAERSLFRQGGRLAWKVIDGKDHLYRVIDRVGNAEYVGPRNAETEKLATREMPERKDARQRARALKRRFPELAAQYRALKLPRIADAAARVLVECDRRALLGSAVLVVGTNAMGAYELEAMDRFATGLDATEDCDLTWSGHEGLALSTTTPLSDAMKAVDSTYTVNAEKPFQIRNQMAYEVELLLPPSRTSGFPKQEKIRPLPLPEQDWLVLGTPVTQIVTSQRGIVTRLVVPDPRYFALHKRWLSDKPERNPRKKGKDRQQAEALWAAIKTSMPLYPVNHDFRNALPKELAETYEMLENGDPNKGPVSA